MNALGAVILAGGKNRRMGGRFKGDLALDGTTFLDRIVGELGGFGEILLSVDRADNHRGRGLTIVEDAVPGAGPLAGIVSALRACRSAALLVLSCDLPLFTRGVADYLAAFLSPGCDAVVAVDRGGREHPLCALYSRTALPALEECLAQGQYRMRDALAALRVAKAPLAHSAYPDAMVANVNTPEEYAALRRAVSGPPVVAVCGIKNSGKTTLLENVIPLLRRDGLRLGVIKHDGHDFVPDVPGTDSFRLREAGAETVAVYSDVRYLVAGVGRVEQTELFRHFRETDLVLLEGGKHSPHTKIEVVRKGVGERPVSDPATLLAVYTDIDLRLAGVPTIAFGRYEQVAQCILKHVRKGALV